MVTDAFYECVAGPRGKQPYAVARQHGQPMALAGLWDGWRGSDGAVVRSFAIIATAVNATLAPIHDRMLVILKPAHWPVGWAANSPRNNAPELLEPVAVPGEA